MARITSTAVKAALVATLVVATAAQAHAFRLVIIHSYGAMWFTGVAAPAKKVSDAAALATNNLHPSLDKIVTQVLTVHGLPRQANPSKQLVRLGSHLTE